MSTMWIIGGSIVLPDEVVTGSLKIEDGRIAEIRREAADDPDRRGMAEATAEGDDTIIIDAGGLYVMPGLVDIHSDAIEKEVQPRPNTMFPLDMALMEFERKLPLHGITSMYHSLSLGVGLSLRGDHYLTQLVELIRRYRSKRSMVRHGIHLRYEVSHLDGLPIVERYIQEKAIDYLSFMNHSPGQGQYREPGSFERYVMKNQGVDREEVRYIVEDLLKRQRQVDWSRLRDLGRLATRNGIAVASHDDDSPERVDESIRYGATVSEFPMNLDTARHAIKRGIRVCVGAPNVVRGGSHDNNMRAADAIAAGAADILCSDYHPSSLLAAIFKLSDDGIIGLPEAVRMGTLHPAQAIGAEQVIGSIEPGKAADLLLVDRYEGYPWVRRTIVGGREVYAASEYYLG